MIKCIVDSSCDLTPQAAEKLNVVILPTPILIDEKEYLDGKDLSVELLTALLGTSGHTVKTRHVRPDAYEEAFLPFAANGDSVICLCCAKSIAGDYESARVAAISVKEKYPDFDITVLDSKSASTGYGMIATKIATLIQNGADKETVLKAADYYIAHVKHYFSVSMMTYFMKGGRISHALGTVGDTLDVRPLFTIDSDGDVENLQPIPIKGSHNMIEAILDIMKNSGVDFSTHTLTFCYGDDKDNIDYFIMKAKETLHPKEVIVTTISCAIAAHTGSSILGVAYLDADDPF